MYTRRLWRNKIFFEKNILPHRAGNKYCTQNLFTNKTEMKIEWFANPFFSGTGPVECLTKDILPPPTPNLPCVFPVQLECIADNKTTRWNRWISIEHKNSHCRTNAFSHQGARCKSANKAHVANETVSMLSPKHWHRVSCFNGLWAANWCKKKKRFVEGGIFFQRYQLPKEKFLTKLQQNTREIF